MDLKVRTTDYMNEDQSWLGSAHATDTGDTITIDLSTFDFVTAFPNGFLPSGVALGKITATGEYGAYGASPSEVQSLTRTSTGGTITLAFDGSPVSVTVPATAAGFTAAAVQAALNGLATINPGDVTVTGAAGGPLTVTFGGRYVGQDVPLLVVDNTSATGGTIVAAVVTAGGGVVADGRETGVGMLFTRVRVDADNKTGKAMGSLLRHCMVREAKLPVGHGVDAAFKADTDGRIIFT